MLTTFDPDRGPGFQGFFTKVEILDPTNVPNLVIDPRQQFEVSLEWNIKGNLVPLYLTALADNWSVEVFAESIGPGPEISIGTRSVPVGPTTGTDRTFSTKVPINAGTLPSNAPAGVPGPSGIYKLVACVFLNSTLGEPGFDIAGFAEGPIIKVENPL